MLYSATAAATLNMDSLKLSMSVAVLDSPYFRTTIRRTFGLYTTTKCLDAAVVVVAVIEIMYCVLVFSRLMVH